MTGHHITFKKLAQCKKNSSMLFLETLNSAKGYTQINWTKDGKPNER